MTIVKAALFLLGMCVSVQVVAALYGFIDLWYTIRTAYPRVVRNIFFWGTVTVVTAWCLGDFYRPAFLWGVVTFVVFYPCTYIGHKLMILRNAGIIEKEEP